MVHNDPDKDWLFDEDIEEDDEPAPIEEKTPKIIKKRKRKWRYGSKIRNKLRNIKYKLSKRPHRRINIPIGLILGLFIPLVVGLLVLYLLLPGLPTIAGLVGTEVTIYWALIFLLIPAEVNSIVPWIAWIISGVVGGLISGRVLIPFISMYILIWVLLYIIEGNMLIPQFSIFGPLGLNQIIIQI